MTHQIDRRDEENLRDGRRRQERVERRQSLVRRRLQTHPAPLAKNESKTNKKGKTR